ncbi:peptidoglycan-binding domain-containing protein [Actinoplanes utahensis]|uniref:peptidoglycan-binding domain-containing protein n=1 Tax=Actinoplanes utahensis TaxID=1869 RepID=UPI000A021CA6|nr:peptidoglycan-binding domain-containing protein [Actinoplanes utahensis]GIF35360.1 hypothetical protein Aut01nite_83460 [Actinoplanes utahensis]
MFTRAMSGVFAAAAVAAVLVTPDAAQAAAPQCNQGSWGRTSVPSYPYVYHPTYNGDLNCVLGYGSAGQAVFALQNSLNKCNGQGIAIDGNFGVGTRQAVKNVQQRYGLTQDGVYGRQTNLAMNWSFNAFTSVGTPSGCYNPA